MRKKTILITGATGFIGSFLCELSIKKGYNVIAFDRYNREHNLGNLEQSKYKDKIKFIFGDIRDYDSVFKAVKNADIIFHLAALIGIPYSYFSPLAYLKTNVEGTYNVLESCKNLNKKKIIITSTSENYGSPIKTPINENHRLMGQSPYSASKISADQIAISYNRSFNLPVKILRPFNTYGPRQSSRAIIPTIISQALTAKKFIYLGNLNTSRDYTYVDDTCESYFKILNLEKFNGVPVNIGSGKNIKIIELAKLIIKMINPKLKIKIDKSRVRPVKSEVDKLVCDNKLILKNTKWKPKVKFKDGIKITIEWMKKNFKSVNKNIYHI